MLIRRGTAALEERVQLLIVAASAVISSIGFTSTVLYQICTGVYLLFSAALNGQVFSPNIETPNMEYKRLSRCGIDSCKQTLFYLDDGQWFCKNGHLREV